jgi:hypothetical protein
LTDRQVDRGKWQGFHNARTHPRDPLPNADFCPCELSGFQQPRNKTLPGMRMHNYTIAPTPILTKPTFRQCLLLQNIVVTISVALLNTIVIVLPIYHKATWRRAITKMPNHFTPFFMVHDNFHTDRTNETNRASTLLSRKLLRAAHYRK